MPLPTTAVPRPIIERQTTLTEVPARNEDYSAGVSWAAVIGGAFVAASLSLILLALGTGLGFSSISLWSNMQTAAATLSKAAIAWMIITQILASAMGGYLAGRLRTKWVQVHTDEVYFRDTAHGLLVWALGMVVTAAFLTSAAASIAGGAAQRNTSQPATANAESSVLNPNAYFVDTLFRPNASAPSSTVPVRTDVADRGEAELILSHAMRQGAISSADKSYLSQMVAARTSLSPNDADQRVSDVFAEAQQSADTARKALAHLSLWLFVALLSGAFCASYAGTIGGKQRDRVLSSL